MLTARTSTNSAITAYPTLRQAHLRATRHIKADSFSLREVVARSTQKRFDNSHFTYFGTGPNDCGGIDKDDILIVRLSPAQWGGVTQCNTSVTVQYQGASFVARITGMCPGCPSGDLDLSPGLFERLSGDLALGEVQGSWTFGNELAITSDNPASTSSVFTPSTISSMAPWATPRPSTNSHSATSSPVVNLSGTTAASSSTYAGNDVHGSAKPGSGSSHSPPKSLIIALPVVLVFLGILTAVLAFGRRRRFGGKSIRPFDFRAPPLLSDTRKSMKLTGGEFAMGGSNGAALLSVTNIHTVSSDFPSLSDTSSYASQYRPFSSTYAQYSSPGSPYGASTFLPDLARAPRSSRGPGLPVLSAISHVPSTVAPRPRPPKAALASNPRIALPESSLPIRETRVVIDHAQTASTAIEHGRGVVVLPAFLEERFLAFLRSSFSGRQRRESVDLSEPLPAYEPRRSPEIALPSDNTRTVTC